LSNFDNLTPWLTRETALLEVIKGVLAAARAKQVANQERGAPPARSYNAQTRLVSLAGRLVLV
jgi:hypothetical protein